MKIIRSLGEEKAGGVFFLLLFYYSYMHTRLGSFLPPCPHPLPYHPLCPLRLLSTLSIPGGNYFALISNFVEERV
jgi:hypothetical protein